MNSIAHATALATEDDRSTVKNYISLMKPRVMSLVIFTGFSGAWLAPSSIHPFIAFIAVLCIALGAGSAGTINMWYDRDIDRLMKRTQKRPLITGVIEADEALSFGIITGFFSVFFMALCVNFLAAALLLFTICYYIFIYTMWLKRSTVQNIVIGGVAGALPPMIGWAAVSNEISTASFTLFLIIFIWTPPHSWSLALFCNEDYKNCNVPMMPVVKGAYYTKKQVLIYSIALFITSLMPFFIEMSNFTYLVIAGILGVIFLYYSISLFRDTSDTGKSAPFGYKERGATPIIIGETTSNDVGKWGSFDCNKQAKRLFAYSIFYLFAIFLALDFCKTAI